MKSAARLARQEQEAPLPRDRTRPDLEEFSSQSSSMILQLQDFRKECDQTVEELRLLDSLMHGLTEGQS
jgi:hypothetical protein